MTIAELQIELAKYSPDADVNLSAPGKHDIEQGLDVAEIEFYEGFINDRQMHDEAHGPYRPAIAGRVIVEAPGLASQAASG
jgi:hypothetical protein